MRDIDDRAGDWLGALADLHPHTGRAWIIGVTGNPGAGKSTLTTSAVERESPPSCPRVAIERMNTSPSSAWRCIRMRSPRIAPPVKGDDGSTATTPTRTPCLR